MQIVLFQSIQFSMSAQFIAKSIFYTNKHFYFKELSLA